MFGVGRVRDVCVLVGGGEVSSLLAPLLENPGNKFKNQTSCSVFQLNCNKSCFSLTVSTQILFHHMKVFSKTHTFTIHKTPLI